LLNSLFNNLQHLQCLQAVNVDGQLRWFQSIDPPPGAPTKLELPIKSTSISVQQQMDELDDELAMSLAEEDQQDEFLVPMLSGEEPVKIKQSSLTDLAWSWSTPDVRKNYKRKKRTFPNNVFITKGCTSHKSQSGTQEGP